MNYDDVKNQLQGLRGPEERPEFEHDVRVMLESRSQDPTVATERVRNTRRHLTIGSSVVGIAAAAVVAILIGSSLSQDDNKGSEVAQQPRASVTQPSTTEIKPLLASTVLAESLQRQATIVDVSGTLDMTEYPSKYPGGGDNPGFNVKGETFQLRARGDLHAVTPGVNGAPNSETWYDAATGTGLQCNGYGPCIKHVNAASTPTWFTSFTSVMNEQSSLLRTLAADDKTPVESVSVDGRNAWKISLTNPNANPADGPDAMTAVIDAESGFAIQLTTSNGGKPQREYSVAKFAVNSHLPDATFVGMPPQGVAVTTADDGYLRMTVDKASQRAGYRVPTPAKIPAGFALADVTFTSSQAYTGWRGGDEYNHNIVTQTYRNGLLSFTFSTRDSGPKGTLWYDNPDGLSQPLDTDPRVTLTDGYFSGVSARSTASATGADVWGVGSQQVFSVVGDLTNDEAIAFVQSLRIG